MQTVQGAAALHQALESWASNHNLCETWCLDDALEFLRTFEVTDDKNLAFGLLPDSYFLVDLLKRTWQSVVIERHSYGLHGIYQSSAAVEERDAFSFRFKYELLAFGVSGPLYKSPADFKQEVEDRFKAVGGPTIRGARKYLNHRLGEYNADFARVSAELNLAPPPAWRKAGDYLTWLVKYQIPPCKTYRQIAREVDKDEKTVREGIQRVASLIGISLRSSNTDKRLGRPGSKDRARRRRVDRRREKVRGNAN